MTLLGDFPQEHEGDEAWHLDPKDSDPRDELARQAAFIRDAKIICPAVDIIAIPNAAKRTKWAAAKAKREGLTAGALDLVATWRGGGVAFLEFKSGKTMPDANQRERLNMLVRQGHKCGVFRQEKTALEFLRQCGAPFLDRPAKVTIADMRLLPDHLAALQMLVNRCGSAEARKDLIVTAGACEAISREEAFTILTANQLETA